MLHTSKPQHAESNLRFLRNIKMANPEGLSNLYVRWNDFVCKKISNVFQNTEDIEDIASEVWVLVQKDSQKWDVDTSGFYLFLTYKIGSAIAEALRVQRTAKRGNEDFQDIRYSLDADTDSQEFIETHIASIDVDVLESLVYKERLEIVSKAIAVCKFPKDTEQMLRLYMQGSTHKQIQERLGFNCSGTVSARLSKAVNEIKSVIDPDTYEVSTLSPRERRKHQKQHLAKQSGAKLAKLCKSKKWGYRELAKVLHLQYDTFLEIVKGTRKPNAPLLKNIAMVLGRDVYAIYAPPLTDRSPYCRQGRKLWYQRVQRGWSFGRVEGLTGMSAGSDIQI